jgi:hypothetical protein
MKTSPEAASKLATALFNHLGVFAPDITHTEVKHSLTEALQGKFILTEKLAQPNGEQQEWVVEAIYRDNDQQWSDRITARTALEAAVGAYIERQTDGGLFIDVTHVEDMDGETGYNPDFIHGLNMESNRVALNNVLNAIRPESLPAQGRAAHRWMLEALAEFDEEDFLDELTDSETMDNMDFSAVHALSVEHTQNPEILHTTSQCLINLCNALEAQEGGILNLEKNNKDLARDVYHVRAVSEYFEPVVDEFFELNEPIAA